MAQIIHALNCFYQKKIAHHDVKTANIFIGENNIFKLGFTKL
jgi:serine/threonine protein kinase